MCCTLRTRALTSTLAIALLCSCEPYTVYTVSRSGFLPLPSIGALTPDRGVAGMYLGGITRTAVIVPTVPGSSLVGAYVPRAQLEGSLYLRPSSHVAIELPFNAGISDDELSIVPTTRIAPTGQSWGLGVGTSGQATLGPDTTLDLALRVMAISVPEFLWTRCSSCPASSETLRQDSATVPVLRALVGIGHRVGPTRLMLALGFTNHPMVTGDEATLDPASASVSIGSMMALVATGVELRVTSWLGLSLRVEWPFTTTPAFYLPLISFGVSFAAENGPVEHPAEWLVH